MNPIEKLEYFSFHTETRKYKNRKVVPFKQAKKIIRELSKQSRCKKYPELIKKYGYCQVAEDWVEPPEPISKVKWTGEWEGRW